MGAGSRAADARQSRVHLLPHPQSPNRLHQVGGKTPPPPLPQGERGKKKAPPPLGEGLGRGRFIMVSGEIQIRVRYAETDRMGLLHHANYLVYFEQARTELLRTQGAAYKELEDQGYLLVLTRV